MGKLSYAVTPNGITTHAEAVGGGRKIIRVKLELIVTGKDDTRAFNDDETPDTLRQIWRDFAGGWFTVTTIKKWRSPQWEHIVRWFNK